MERFDELVGRWQLSIDRVAQSPVSVIGFGSRGAQRVVLKVVKAEGDEWRTGEITAAFDGHGVVRVLQHEPGAALVEELRPGTPLAGLMDMNHDASDIKIIADVIRRMQNSSPHLDGVPTAETWGLAFDRYLASDNLQLPLPLVEDARARYARLCSSQRRPRCLHGDLQHTNILWDEARGWTAIDPKGVVAELEYEIIPALRNPHDMPDLYSSPAMVSNRIEHFASELDVDPARVTEWAFAQGVLSAVWTIEDDGTLNPSDPALLLALSAKELLG